MLYKDNPRDIAGLHKTDSLTPSFGLFDPKIRVKRLNSAVVMVYKA